MQGKRPTRCRHLLNWNGLPGMAVWTWFHNLNTQENLNSICESKFTRQITHETNFQLLMFLSWPRSVHNFLLTTKLVRHCVLHSILSAKAKTVNVRAVCTVYCSPGIASFIPITRAISMPIKSMVIELNGDRLVAHGGFRLPLDSMRIDFIEVCEWPLESQWSLRTVSHSLHAEKNKVKNENILLI